VLTKTVVSYTKKTTTHLEILNKKIFLESIEKIRTEKNIKESHYQLTNLTGRLNDEFVLIDNEVFKDIDFSNLKLDAFDFVNCVFDNCDFGETTIWCCMFKNCKFVHSYLTTLRVFESEFQTTTIENCKCGLLHFADCSFKNLNFDNCYEILDAYFGNCIFEETAFNKSSVIYCRFEDNISQESPELEFKDCLISRNYFTNIDLEKFKFSNFSSLNLNSFQNCIIREQTFDESVNTTGQEYNSIDFSTINKSIKLDYNLLKTLFGILNSDIKEYVFGLTNDVKFQSVFISYSFKNKKFAKRLNSALMSKGVITFLWEKDANGGKGLNKIMKENVNKFDRVLFIASEDSLRSIACQFELTEGRKKQEKLWKDIYFPIHIDNYLFNVQEDDIRPLEKQDEYWKNIQELKKLNSLDFSKFLNNSADNKFDEAIYNLVRDLKK